MGIMNEIRSVVDPVYGITSGNDAFQAATNPIYGLYRGGTLSAGQNLANVLHGRNVENRLEGANQTGVGGYYTVNEDGTYNVLGNQGQDRGTMSAEEYEQYVQYGIDPSSKRRAENLQAAITREQFDLEQELYRPLEDYLLDTIDNPVYHREQAMKAYQSGQGQGERFDAAQDRRLTSLGIQPTQAQQQSMDRQSEFNEATSRISNYNNALRASQDREYALLGAGLQGIPEAPGA